MNVGRYLRGEDRHVGTARTTQPQPPQRTEQKPVAWICEGSSSDEKHAIDYWPKDLDAIPIGTMLYTHPPQRTWVDVPDEEIKRLWIQYRAALPRYLCFAKALLARAKEENT